MDNYDNENNSEESNAPQDSLFESHQEFDIYCDRGKAINYIFHGKELNYEIDYLEFNISIRRITAYTKDGKAQDGVEVPMKIITD